MLDRNRGANGPETNRSFNLLNGCCVLEKALPVEAILPGRVLSVEEFPASLFFWPVQPFSEFTPGDGVNKRSELVFGQITAESF